MSQKSQTINYELSRALAERVPPVPKECYSNSVKALFALDMPGAVYVEGYAVGIIAFEHGWIETESGEVVDVTLCGSGAPEQEREFKFFPALRYTRADIQARMRSRSKITLPFFMARGSLGMSAYSVRAACLAANEAAYGPEVASMLEKSWAGLLELAEAERQSERKSKRQRKSQR